MKKSILKSRIIRVSCFSAAIGIGLIGFMQSSNKQANAHAVIKLRDLYRISNANAEGNVTCSENGSNCTVTINGQPGQITGKKQ